MNPQSDTTSPINQDQQPGQRPSWGMPPAPPAQPQTGMPASPLVGGGAPAGTVIAPSGSKKKRLLIASIIAGVIVVVGGGSAAAYYGYILPNKPQNILGAALANQFAGDKANTEHAHGTFSMKGNDNVSVAGTFKSAVDKNGAFDISGDVDAAVTKVTFDARSLDAKDLYVRVGGLDGLAGLMEANANAADGAGSTMSVYAPLVNAVNNKWFLINNSLLQQVQTGIDISDGFKLSDGDRQKLADAYKKHQFLVVRQKLGDEKIGTHKSHHLKVVIGKQELKSFVAEVKAAGIGTMKITDDQLREVNKSIDGADFNKYPVDIWVSKAEKMIDQVSFVVKEGGDELAVKYIVDTWNEPVKPAKPADAQSLLELLSDVYGGGQDVDVLLNSQERGSGISL